MLQPLQFTMQYCKEKANANVDALSRAFGTRATGVLLDKGDGEESKDGRPMKGWQMQSFSMVD